MLLWPWKELEPLGDLLSVVGVLAIIPAAIWVGSVILRLLAGAERKRRERRWPLDD